MKRRATLWAAMAERAETVYVADVSYGRDPEAARPLG